MLVEITNYYALEGQVEAVLAQRVRASELRVRLGLPPGRIYQKVEGAGPDVRWECIFETRAAFDADIASRAASIEFTRMRQEMHTLLEKFERNLQELVGASWPTDVPSNRLFKNRPEVLSRAAFLERDSASTYLHGDCTKGSPSEAEAARTALGALPNRRCRPR